MNTKQNTRINFQNIALFHGIWSSCINCDEWRTGKNPECNRFKVLPPPEVIAVGCQFWLPQIPF